MIRYRRGEYSDTLLSNTYINAQVLNPISKVDQDIENGPAIIRKPTKKVRKRIMTIVDPLKKIFREE